RHGERPDRGLRALAGGLRVLQPPHDVRGARVVHAELLHLRRQAARAVRRGRIPDAGRHLGGRERGPGAQVHHVLPDAAKRRRGAHETFQARLGSRRLGVRRPPPAVREVLRRGVLHRAQPRLPRDAVGRVPRHRRRPDGELRRSGVARQKESRMTYSSMTELVIAGWTGREAETIGVTLSKQLCAKPISQSAWRYDEVKPHWERLILRSWTDGKLYQEGPVTAMRSPEDLMERHGGLEVGHAMFCGTLAAIGGIRGGERFRMELEDPVLKRKLSHEYRVKVLPIVG